MSTNTSPTIMSDCLRLFEKCKGQQEADEFRVSTSTALYRTAKIESDSLPPTITRHTKDNDQFLPYFLFIHLTLHCVPVGLFSLFTMHSSYAGSHAKLAKAGPPGRREVKSDTLRVVQEKKRRKVAKLLLFIIIICGPKGHVSPSPWTQDACMQAPTHTHTHTHRQ